VLSKDKRSTCQVNENPGANSFSVLLQRLQRTSVLIVITLEG